MTHKKKNIQIFDIQNGFHNDPCKVKVARVFTKKLTFFFEKERSEDTIMKFENQVNLLAQELTNHSTTIKIVFDIDCT
jgi:hypothetical protein